MDKYMRYSQTFNYTLFLQYNLFAFIIDTFKGDLSALLQLHLSCNWNILLQLHEKCMNRFFISENFICFYQLVYIIIIMNSNNCYYKNCYVFIRWSAC